MERRRIITRLAFILALAFGLRAACAVGLQWRLESNHQQYLIPGDADGYWNLAEDLAEGREYSFYTPPRRVLRMPGFPALLAVSMKAFGDSQLPARLLLAAVGALGCAAVFWLGRALFSESIGLMAALITTIVPTFIGFSPLILSETAFAVALVASLVPAAVAAKRLRTGDSLSKVICPAMLCGALVGLANYMRPSWLLAAPLLGIVLIAEGRANARAWMAAGAIIAATFVTLLPWGIRNQRVTGHFLLTTLWMGPSLYDGLSPEATGDSDMAFYDRENLLGRMSEYDVDRAYRDRAWTYAKEHPGRAVELAFIKLGRYWKPWPNASQFDRWYVKCAVFISSVPLWIAAAYTIFRCRPGWIAIALTIGPILYFSAVHTVFVGSLRYRLPAEYPLAVLAAAGWQSWRGAKAAIVAEGRP
jgi:4-amino-4-deoxy-L-arabinose transferase-like glycosyltransferase